MGKGYEGGGLKHGLPVFVVYSNIYPWTDTIFFKCSRKSVGYSIHIIKGCSRGYEAWIYSFLCIAIVPLGITLFLFIISRNL